MPRCNDCAGDCEPCLNCKKCEARSGQIRAERELDNLKTTAKRLVIAMRPLIGPLRTSLAFWCDRRDVLQGREKFNTTDIVGSDIEMSIKDIDRLLKAHSRTCENLNALDDGLSILRSDNQ